MNIKGLFWQQASSSEDRTVCFPLGLLRVELSPCFPCAGHCDQTSAPVLQSPSLYLTLSQNRKLKRVQPEGLAVAPWRGSCKDCGRKLLSGSSRGIATDRTSEPKTSRKCARKPPAKGKTDLAQAITHRVAQQARDQRQLAQMQIPQRCASHQVPQPTARDTTTTMTPKPPHAAELEARKHLR